MRIIDNNRYNDVINENYTATHVHTDCSLLDGLSKVSDLVAKAKSLGQTALAVTDHGSLGNALSLWKECNKNGLKPLLGNELYYTEDTNILSLEAKERNELAKEKAIKDGVNIPPKAKAKDIKELIAPYQYNTTGYHLLFIAKNQTGWINLMKLSGEASDKCTFNGRPHCDLEMIRQYSEGLICSTACLGGYVGQCILDNKEEQAIQYIELLEEIFGEDLYLEIQPFVHGEQVVVNEWIIDYANKNNIKLLTGIDSHYTEKEDHYVHDILLCIGTGSKQKETDRFKFDNQFWYMTIEEVLEQYQEQMDSYEIQNPETYINAIFDSLHNTNVLAESVSNNIKLKADKPIMPEVEIPPMYRDDNAYLSALCWARLYQHIKKNGLQDKRQTYEARLKHELNVICTKGYASYFLIVKDFIDWGNANQCPFGPGRGSAAGSLVAFLLGIVKGTDPIEYDLLFFRFLTMDRKDLPDIDSDVDRLNRQRCIDYMEHKYGMANTSQVGTWTMIGVKNGLKDVARVLDLPFVEANELTKNFDDGTTWKDIDEMEEGEQKEKIQELEKKYAEIFRVARKLNGVKRGPGIHAGGIIVTPSPVNNFYPTRTVKGRKVSMWDKNEVEEIGACKIDLLGLATVSMIRICLENIEKTTGIKMTLDDLYNNKDIRNDADVLDMISREQTESIFQFESNLFKSIIKGMQPDSFDDCIALTSIARPGPLGAGLDKVYNDRKHGIDENTDFILGSFPYMESTYNTTLYQEQPMLLAKDIAGFSDSQADSYLRKSMAKKKRELLELCKQWFVYGKPQEDEYGPAIKGGIANGYKEEDLLEYFDSLDSYCSYLFNKSHATSYSLNSMITAWLKRYYPVEFYASVLSIQEDTERCINYMHVIEDQFDIITVHPDINKSGAFFTPDPETNSILFGFNSIKGVGAAALAELVEKQPFASLEDFLARCSTKTINKKVIEALIKAGCFDCFNENRYEVMNDYYRIRKVKNVEMYDELAYNTSSIVEFETEALEIPLTAKPWFQSVKMDERCRFKAEITKITEKYDRNNRLMAFMQVKTEEESINLELVAFSSVYTKHMHLLEVGRMIDIEGTKCDASKVKVIRFKKVR